MKTSRLACISVVALLFAACEKESQIIENTPDSQDKLTFSANIELAEDTRASLSGLNIEWSAGDHIGVASDQNDDIQDCTITVDPGNAKRCTFTIKPVDGATTYYAIYTGSSSFTNIAFDHTTATFSGKAAGNLSVVYEYYSATSVTAADLTMAGKTTTNNITMKPCLALVQLQVGSKSVENELKGGYSGVRGWKLSQLGSSKYSAGDYTVNLSGENLSVSPNSSFTRKEARTFSSGTMLSNSTTYYTCIIPGGSVNGFKLDFLGFKPDPDDGSKTVLDFSTKYSMTLMKSLTVSPGDSFNFGTLDPVTKQKDLDAFDPAIDIDGVMTEWASISAHSTKDTAGDVYIVEWKTTSDKRNIYFYYKIKKSSITYSSGSYNWGSYVQTYYDTDKDGNNDARSYVYPFKGSTEGTIEFKTGSTGAVEVPVGNDLGEYVATNGCVDENYAYVEISLPRSMIGASASGKQIIVRHQMVSGGQTTSGETITLSTY